MKIAIDFRPVVAAPYSGIARQASALRDACAGLPGIQAIPCSEAPLDHPLRAEGLCPPDDGPVQGLQRPAIRWRFEAKFLPAAIKEQNIALYIATANMGLPIARKGSCKYVVLIHDLFQLTEKNFHRSPLKAFLYRLIDWASIRWSVQVADAIWCPSAYTAQQVRARFPRAAGKVQVLANYVPSFTLEGDIKPLLSTPYWLLVGTREPRKNISFFLENWKNISATQTLPDVVLVGDPEDFPDWKAVPGVHWFNGVSEAELTSLYCHADCLWQPSFAEGFGMPVVEALSVGTPVAVAKGSALDEVAPPNSPRFLHDSANELQDCMRSIAQQPLPKGSNEYYSWAQRFGKEAYAVQVQQRLEGLLPLCSS